MARRFGQVGKQRQHFRARLEPMFGRELAAVAIADQRAFGDAEQRVMRFVVGARGEIRLVGRDQRQAGAIGEIEELRLDRALALKPVALQLDIEPPVEQRRQRVERGARELRPAREAGAVERPRRAAGQRDEAFRVAGERGSGQMRRRRPPVSRQAREARRIRLR